MKRNAQQSALAAASNLGRYVKEWLFDQADSVVDSNRAVLQIDEQATRAVAGMGDSDRAKQVAGNFFEDEVFEDAVLLGG